MSPTPSGSWAPLGRALRDFTDGNASAALEVWRDGEREGPLPAAVFFRGVEEMAPVEELALSLAEGRVLDVGASAGAHALALEAAGARVVAIDQSPVAVEIMRARGLRDARAADIFTFEDDAPFDTLLLLMNGIGIAGTLGGLDRLLVRARKLLRPHGQVLCDSTDLRVSEDPAVLRQVEAKIAAGAYFGEVVYELRYGGLAGAPYPWLYVDPETLHDHARRAGFHDQILFEDEDRQFLARLIAT